MTSHHKPQFSEQYSLTTCVNFVCNYKEILYFQMTNYKKTSCLIFRHIWHTARC